MEPVSLRNAREGKRRDTPAGKLVSELFKQIASAKKALAAGRATHAMVDLEYCETILADTFAEHPELKRTIWNQPERDETKELIDRVANLNPEAGEIGAGMLQQLVTAARRIQKA
jgi:hypothetical protein